MPSKSRLVSKAFSTSGVLSTIATENPTVDTGTTQIANVDALPTSGNETGDQLFIEATNRLYIWNGSGWYNIALINTSPTWDSGGQPASSYELDVDSPQDATIISLAASDAEGLPIQYSYVTSGSMDSMATISQDSSVFTITPKTFDEVGEEVELFGSITFRASDGVNILPSISSFVLNFVFTVENSKYTTLLLEAVDTSDNNNIIDSSSNNHAITVTGDAKAGSYSPYRHGGYSTYFDGTGDYLTVSNLGLSGDLTIEGWFYQSVAQSATYRCVIGASTYASGVPLRIYTYDSNFVVWLSSTGGPHLSGSFTANTWHHVALVRSSGTWTLYIDGVSAGTNTTSGTYDFASTVDWTLGADAATTYPFTGYLSDVRIVESTAVYTSNFTPPSTRLTAITNTSLLTCHLPYFADGSTNNHAITVSGNPATSPFGPYDNKKYSATSHGGSVYFDGSGDYLTISNDTSLNLANTSFTIECWVFPVLDYSNYRTIFSKRVSGNTTTSYQGYLSTSTGYIGFYNGTIYESSTVLVSNAWSHCAWVYDGTNIKIFVNGTQVLSQTTSISEIDEPLSIGFTRGYTEIFGGYISDFRIVKGTAVYTGNFTPPTFPLTAVTNTSLLLSGTDASIIDKSQQAGNITLPTGVVGESTTVVHANSKSINFMVDDDTYCTFYNPFTFAGEFTIEFWYNLASVLNGQGTNVNSNYHTLLNLGNTFIVRFGDGGFGNYLHFIVASGFTGIDILPKKSDWIVGTGWHHFAATRDASNYIRYYWDGSLMNSARTTGPGNAIPDINHGFNNASSLRAGTFGAVGNRTIGTGFRGYLQDLRITNGLRRYTANFTPPTEPLLG